MALISFEDVTFNYESVMALSSVNLDIEEGEFIAVIGHNGSGKSTLAKHINALFTPKQGRVFVASLDTSIEENIIKIRQNAGMVFQNPDNQMVTTIVEEDVAFGPENLGIEPKEIRKRVDDALETVKMSQYAQGSPHQLSGGQKQRIAIAGILAMRPNIIVFDEPTAMLDPNGRKEVLETAHSLNREGITIVWITHFMEEAVDADRVVVMSGGKVEIQGTPREVFSRYEEIDKLELDIPLALRLSKELREQGIDIQSAISEEELVEELCRLLSNT